jgi:cell filamentation protein
VANSYTDANGVYRNKLGITDAAQLKRTEYHMAGMRSDEILSKRVDLGVQGFGLARQKAIHGHLFQDVYEWAGKTRTVPSSKRMENGMVSVFANPDTFEESWQELEKRTQVFVKAQGLTFEQKHTLLASIFVEANRIHPFPEGNGRSLQVFMKELAREQGIDLDYTKTNAKDWNRASAISGTYGELLERQYLIPNPSDSGPIKKIFADMASPSRALESIIRKDEQPYRKATQAPEQRRDLSQGAVSTPAPKAKNKGLRR